MADATVKHKTNIQWTHVPGYIGATWNPTTGCTRVSPGCDHCYAFELHDQRHLTNRAQAEMDIGTDEVLSKKLYDKSWKQALELLALKPAELIPEARRRGFPPRPVHSPQYDVPFSQVQVLDDKRLTEPLRARKPHSYFVDSMADLFHEDVPDRFIDRVFAVMALTPQHIFMVLTKRPDRMRAYFKGITDADTEHGPRAKRIFNAMYSFDLWPDVSEQGFPTTGEWPLPNVWLGVSVEDQERADERIPLLLDTPAAVRFLSCEPLLGPVELLRGAEFTRNYLEGIDFELLSEWPDDPPRIDWVIAGGESGRHARPFDIAWARSLRDQCASAGVPFFMKQIGSRPMLPLTEAGSREWHAGLASGLWRSDGTYRRGEDDGRLGFALRLRNAHGSDPDEWPEDLRVRQWPGVAS